MIHSLAGELGLDVYIVSLSRMGLDDTSLSSLISELPERCIALMEDIDAAFHHGLTRDLDEEKKDESREGEKEKEKEKAGAEEKTEEKDNMDVDEAKEEDAAEVAAEKKRKEKEGAFVPLSYPPPLCAFPDPMQSSTTHSGRSSFLSPAHHCLRNHGRLLSSRRRWPRCCLSSRRPLQRIAL